MGKRRLQRTARAAPLTAGDSPTSMLHVTVGLNLDSICLASSLAQLMDLNQGCRLTASEPCGPAPRRLAGSRVSSPLSSV